MYICIRVRWSDLALENRSFYMWVFTLSPRYIPSVRPLLLHFFTTQQRNDLINRSPSISPGRESRGGDILGGRNNVSQDARVKIAQRSGTGDRFHHAARCGPLLSLCSFPLLPLLRPLGSPSPSLPRPLFPSSVLLFLSLPFLRAPSPRIHAVVMRYTYRGTA